jgi:hypothetical protein
MKKRMEWKDIPEKNGPETHFFDRKLKACRLGAAQINDVDA